MTAPWLPRELVGLQPYSMGPLVRRVFGLQARLAEDFQRLFPPMGTIYAFDNEEQRIRTCLVAPRSVQLAAQRAGVPGIIMVKPKGLDRFLTSRLRFGGQEESK